MLGQQYFTNAEYIPFLKEHCILVTFNVDADPGRALANQYRVPWFPSTLLIRSDGTLFDMVQGYDDGPDAYHEKVKSILLEGQGYADIHARAEAHPDDLAARFSLAWKCLDMVYLNEAETLLEALAAQADSSAVTVSVRGKPHIPLAEAVAFAQGVLAAGSARNPNRLLDFQAAYPASALRRSADNELARLFLRRPRHRQAEAFFKGLKARYPENTTVMSYCVRFAVASGKMLDEAEPLLRALLKRQSEDEGTRELAARFYLKKGEVDVAMTHYGPAYAQTLWEDAGALNAYAWFWAERIENLVSAEAAALRSIALDDQANTWDTLSMVYWKQGRHQKAIAAEERAIAMSDHPDYHQRIKAIQADLAEKE